MPKILPDGSRDWTEEMNAAMAEEDELYSKTRAKINILRRKLKVGDITEEEYQQGIQRIREWKE